MNICPDCRAEVSPHAAACPKCGRPLKESKSVFHYVFWGVVSLVVTVAILGAIAFLVVVVLGTISEVNARRERDARAQRIEKEESEKSAAIAKEFSSRTNAPATPKDEVTARLEAKRAEDERPAIGKREWVTLPPAEDDPTNGTKARVFKFYKETAVSGDGYAQLRIARMYATGDGVEKDLAQAGRWFSNAALNGKPEASAEWAKINATNPPAK